jgi:hypothetical protein
MILSKDLRQITWWLFWRFILGQFAVAVLVGIVKNEFARNGLFISPVASWIITTVPLLILSFLILNYLIKRLLSKQIGSKRVELIDVK